MIIYVSCWPILAFLAGKLIPAIGSGDISKVSNIIIKSLLVFLVQKLAQYGQDIFIAKPSLEISENIRIKLFSRIQRIKINFIENEETRETFQKKIEKNIHKEIIMKTTLLGPHKDRISFLFKNKSLKKHASQGEHKVFLAILKITELLFINKKKQSCPIFLIDDLFANLDIDKSKKITNFLNEIKKTNKIKPQTIITTTDVISLKKNEFFKKGVELKKHKLISGCKA